MYLPIDGPVDNGRRLVHSEGSGVGSARQFLSRRAVNVSAHYTADADVVPEEEAVRDNRPCSLGFRTKLSASGNGFEKEIVLFRCSC